MYIIMAAGRSLETLSHGLTRSRERPVIWSISKKNPLRRYLPQGIQV